jgi:hypothetical protein
MVAAPFVIIRTVFCTACGTELPDDANFCLRCGKPQRDGVAAPAAAVADADPDARWETCRISFVKGIISKQLFVAVVAGPKAQYRVVEPQQRQIYVDDHGPRRRDRNTSASYSALVQRLVREGWEPAGSDQHWWEERFRRPAVERPFERCEIALRGNRFVADAIGPKGQYDAAVSDKLSGITDRTKLDRGRNAHQKLVAQLEQDGWQRLPEHGEGWWELYFRRPVASS